MSETLPIDASRDQLVSQRTAELKRMRLLAAGLLVLMTGVFAVTTALAAWRPFLVYPRAFAEAAMVGACADWFAVVALFRHPFGIPIPHTAIVPRHKKRIGDALGRFISVNFLAPDAVAAKLEKIDASGWNLQLVEGAGKYEADGATRARAVAAVARLCPPRADPDLQPQCNPERHRTRSPPLRWPPMFYPCWWRMVITTRFSIRRSRWRGRSFVSTGRASGKESPSQHLFSSELGRRKTGRRLRSRIAGYPRRGTRFG